MAEKLDLIVIGESLIELSSSESLYYANTLNKYYGGDTLTTAISALRMGSRVGFISRIGMDCFKDYLLDSWQAEGLDISQVKPVNGFNGLYIISRISCEEKEFAYYRRKTAATHLCIDDISEDYIKSASCVYSTGLTQSLSLTSREAVKRAYEIAKENKILCAYDPNFNSKVWSNEEAKEAFEEISDYLDIIFLNIRNDSKVIPNTDSIDLLIKFFRDKGISTVVIKSHLDKGYYIGYNGEVNFTEYLSQEPVDVTGAGDVFNGAFLHALNSGKTPFEAGRFASIVAGLQTQNVGAIKSIPEKSEVMKHYKGING